MKIVLTLTFLLFTCIAHSAEISLTAHVFKMSLEDFLHFMSSGNPFSNPDNALHTLKKQTKPVSTITISGVAGTRLAAEENQTTFEAEAPISPEGSTADITAQIKNKNVSIIGHYYSGPATYQLLGVAQGKDKLFYVAFTRAIFSKVEQGAAANP